MSTTTANKTGRWYDRHPELARLLEKLKPLEKGRRNVLIRSLKHLIATGSPGLIDKTVMEYPLTYKRRWYDADPLLWLTINGLSYCDAALLKKATALLRESLAG